MKKIFGKLIAVIWWLWIVVAVLLIASVAGLVIDYFLFEWKYFLATVLLSFFGLVGGIIWAEKTRRRVGLDKFFGTITGAPTKHHDMTRKDY